MGESEHLYGNGEGDDDGDRDVAGDRDDDGSIMIVSAMQRTTAMIL